MSVSWDYETLGTASVTSVASLPSFDEDRVHVRVSGVDFYVSPSIFHASLVKLPWKEGSRGVWELYTPPVIFQMLLDYASFRRLSPLTNIDSHAKRELATLAAALGFVELHAHAMELRKEKKSVPTNQQPMRSGSWRRLFARSASARALAKQEHQQAVETADFVL